MSVSKRARALSLPAAAWPAVDARRWLARGLALAFCLGAALALTALRLEITRLQYDLSKLHGVRQELAARVEQLEVEGAALAASRRIEEQARKRGFVFPHKGSVVLLDE